MLKRQTVPSGAPEKALQIDLAAIDLNTPLRLDVAARLAYPDGSMTASGLRREISRGRLECERVAGKQYVTLAGIKQMRELCRESRKVPASTLENDGAASRSGLSSTEKARSALVAAQTIAEALKKPSPSTLPVSTGQTGRIVTLQR
ncbi:excisionase [Bradyrhizobium sp. Pha-3]|uniref:excisionase n=1 Tax=Bradyrhizobium sp. Pha-3 TaxID=208375 RepID=UPI0035D4C0FD